MEQRAFYKRLHEAVSAQGRHRHKLLSKLHGDVLREYLGILDEIDEQRSAQVCADGRTLGQIVGHIAEWDRYVIQALAQIITGVRSPRIMRLVGYVDLDGEVRDFDSTAEFNAHQAAKHARWPWHRIQGMAQQVAQDLRGLLADEWLLSAERLQDTEPYDYELPPGNRLTLPVGWYLWVVSLEHCGVEHASDFGAAV